MEEIKTRMKCPVCDKKLYFQVKKSWFYLGYRLVCLNCGSVDFFANSLNGLQKQLTADEK